MTSHLPQKEGSKPTPLQPVATLLPVASTV